MKPHRPTPYRRSRRLPAHRTGARPINAGLPDRRPAPCQPAARLALAAANWIREPTPVLVLSGDWRSMQAAVVARLIASAHDNQRTVSVATARRVLAGEHPGSDLLVVVGCAGLRPPDITALVAHAAIRASAGRTTVLSLPNGLDADEQWVPALRRAFGSQTVRVVRHDEEADR